MKRAGQLLLAALALSIGSPVIASSNASFPGGPSSLKSPDGSLAIVSKEAESNGEPSKFLYLENRQKARGQKKKAPSKKVYEYGRCVEVIWSPDSKHFVVNDLAGSDIAMPMLFSVDKLNNPVDLSELLTKAIKEKRDRQSLTKNDHLYFRCIKWANPKTMEIAVAGHGSSDQSGFTLVYEHEVGGGFKKIKRVPEEKLLAIQ